VGIKGVAAGVQILVALDLGFSTPTPPRPGRAWQNFV